MLSCHICDHETAKTRGASVIAGLGPREPLGFTIYMVMLCFSNDHAEYHTILCCMNTAVQRYELNVVILRRREK